MDLNILSVTAVAQRLGVSVGKVRNMADSGKLPFTRDTARRRLFLAEDVQKFIEKKTTPIHRKPILKLKG